MKFYKYLQQHLGSEYDFTESICNEFALLAEYLYQNNIDNRNKILRDLFFDLNLKEKVHMPLHLMKTIYF